MVFPSNYKAISRSSVGDGKYTLCPIRFEDRKVIMKWRNEQIYHLRQRDPLTEEDQDIYYKSVVAKLFEKDFPEQFLFSFLEDGECIGYGGLVHINWVDKNAEISFIMDTKLEKDLFQHLWVKYLEFLKVFAFEELGLHKIYTYAFDLRPHLYVALEAGGMELDGRLKEHCYFNGKYIDVVIHQMINR
jgi:RimJ/RimL family protein N-acetyltransferase